MNIHLKIEAKQNLNSVMSIQRLAEMMILTPSQALNQFYNTFSKDTFSLHYRVQKLSKKARRQN
jgi:hypothetical protein